MFDAKQVAGSESGILKQRPYIATNGRYAGQPVVATLGRNGYEEQPVTNATLRKDEWLQLDQQLVEAARRRLVIVDDFRSNGMVQNVGGLGTLISEWETGSALTDASATMDGESTAEQDNQEFGLDGVPIPVLQKPFKLSDRQLMASRTRGAALDTTTGQEAARQVAQLMESCVFNGLNLGNVKGYNVKGISNHPAVNQFTMAKDWTATATTGKDILTDVLGMIKAAETSERAYGPFNLYVAGDVAFQLRQDYTSNYAKTLRDRLLEIDVLDNIRVADAMASGTAALVQMESSTIDIGMASDVTTIQWESGSGWTHYYQVFSAMAPRIRQDFDGHTGIVYGSK